MADDIILGAGIAGIGAWYANNNLEIYEATNGSGGLCGSFEIQGFYFDNAVHLSFSKIDIVKKIFSRTSHYTHHPIPKSWYHSLWMKHPAQNNLYPLSVNEKVEAISEFLKRDRDIEVNSFETWNKSRYGEYLWKHFFEVYNKKYWDVELDILGIDWIENRIYQPSIEEILYGSYTDKTPNTYYASEMRYPKKGGYYSFIKPIVDEAEKFNKIHYGYEVSKIDLASKKIVFKNDEFRYYENLYSSIPMDRILNLVQNMPSDLSAIDLDFTRVAIVSIGLKKSCVKQIWFYIYDEDIMASRAYMPSIKAKSNAPDDMESIQFEIYFNAKKDPPINEIAIENCIYALKKMGIAEEEDVLFSDFRILPYGNVLLKEGDNDKVRKIIGWLESRNIYPIGRFGRWEYLWSDQSFMSGYETVRRDKR